MIRENGALPLQTIRAIMRAGYLMGANEENLQPSSIDLTVTDEIYQMRGSCLPRSNEPIPNIIQADRLRKHSIDEPLLPHRIYWAKLAESLALPSNIHGLASNKSSSGRLNLRGRLLADGVPRFDSIPAGYHGDLWIEIMPKSFPVRLHPGDRINQIRLMCGDARLNRLEHQLLFDEFKLLRDFQGNPIPSHPDIVGAGITMTIDLSSRELIGWKALPSVDKVIDTRQFDYRPEDFFIPVERTSDHELILHPNTFYVFGTKEKIITPPNYATEMVAYDSSKGEFRSHFAGFFDPGWGWRENEKDRGDIAVLEIEAYGHDFILRDGQPICLMVYEHMLEAPEKLYGQDLKSNYQGQTGPRLAKWFRAVEEKV